MTPPAEYEPSSRHLWMDICRGSAILAVISFHLVTFSERHGFQAPWRFAELNEVLALFRIPTLVFLSGMLLQRSLRKPTPAYILGKMNGILWPYVVWTTIYCFAVLQTPLSELEGIARQYAGFTYLWYLLFLTIYYLAALPLKSVNPYLLAAGAMAVAAFSPEGSRFGERLFFLMSFFFLGHAATLYSERWLRLLRSNWVWLLIPVSAAASYLSVTYNLQYSPKVAVASVTGIIVIAAVGLRVERYRIVQPLAWVGERSLIFYVVHVPVLYAVGWSLGELGVTSFPVFAACTVTAVMAAAGSCAYAKSRWSAVRLLFVGPFSASAKLMPRERGTIAIEKHS